MGTKPSKEPRPHPSSGPTSKDGTHPFWRRSHSSARLRYILASLLSATLFLLLLFAVAYLQRKATSLRDLKLQFRRYNASSNGQCNGPGSANAQIGRDEGFSNNTCRTWLQTSHEPFQSFIYWPQDDGFLLKWLQYANFTTVSRSTSWNLFPSCSVAVFSEPGCTGLNYTLAATEHFGRCKVLPAGWTGRSLRVQC
ncbi:hypothetical protein LTR62_006481 [Meristemomyces frigidus]|uniref:Uncharacterized protein n=1 Tax=Meristemomyces frigidus TaxID=1508187 RepID=A0AAN7TCG6_9PEZI|nr:hypothetical protein LTR62_006481 [Meristemomyces frigidus]